MKTMKLEFYKDAKKQHRARLRARNGKIVWATTEGYKRFAGARNAWRALLKFAVEG